MLRYSNIDMRHQILIPLLIISCIAFSCRKEKSNQSTVEFDVDGVHHSFIPQYASVANDPPNSGWLEIANNPRYYYMRLIILDDSMLVRRTVRPIKYPSTDCGCIFALVYSDTFSCQYGTWSNPLDTLSLEITSVENCVLNGTFEAKYSG